MLFDGVHRVDQDRLLGADDGEHVELIAYEGTGIGGLE